MMERKFTDDDIVKALRCCVESSHFGEYFDAECPMISEDGCDAWTDDKLLKATIDLINRQKAEIEEKSNRLREVLSIVAELKTEAIKEFAERLKKEIRDAYFAYEADSQCEYIDNLVKEMTGEDNGN